MIDLHAHILPGLDDGPGTLEQAVAMARLAVADGITTMVASPHAMNGLYRNDTAGVQFALARLQAELSRQQIALTVLPGMEVHLHLHILRELKLGRLLGINATRYILIELPDSQIPLFADEVFFELMANGITPVLMHPERNQAIQRDPRLLARYRENGILAVLAVNSLTGGTSPATAETARLLLRRRLVQAVASDAHSLRSRPPCLAAGYRIAAGLLGPSAPIVLADNPARIIAGERLAPEAPEPPRRSGLFGWLRRP